MAKHISEGLNFGHVFHRTVESDSFKDKNSSIWWQYPKVSCSNRAINILNSPREKQTNIFHARTVQLVLNLNITLTRKICFTFNLIIQSTSQEHCWIFETLSLDCRRPTADSISPGLTPSHHGTASLPVLSRLKIQM